MKAMEINSFGGSELLQLNERTEPTPNSGEVLVGVHATSVNPADSKMREGGYPYAANVSFPYVLGRDFSGVIKACGAGVDEFEPGDPVFGVLPAGVDGTYQEALTIDASIIAAKPDSLSHSEMAALALTGLTALVSVEDTLKLQANERILIQGGAGGVGNFAIQLAHHLGAEVITTASPANHDYLLDLGANQVIDYNTQDFTEVLSDIDAVFDLIGGEVHQRSFKVLKPGGRLAYIGPLLDGATPPRDDVDVIRPNVGRDRPHLLRILELHDAGAIIAPDIQILSLAEAAQAHDLIDTHHIRGKIVLQIK